MTSMRKANISAVDQAQIVKSQLLHARAHKRTSSRIELTWELHTCSTLRGWQSCADCTLGTTSPLQQHSSPSEVDHSLHDCMHVASPSNASIPFTSASRAAAAGSALAS